MALSRTDPGLGKLYPQELRVRYALMAGRASASRGRLRQSKPRDFGRVSIGGGALCHPTLTLPQHVTLIRDLGPTPAVRGSMGRGRR